MIVYHVTFGTDRLQSILTKGLLPSTTKVFGEGEEDTYNKIFFGRTLEECRHQLNLLQHPIHGDEIHLTIQLPKDYKLREDKWGYLYGTKPVPLGCIISYKNFSELLRNLRQKGE